jgi:hypothetical protein
MIKSDRVYKPPKPGDEPPYIAAIVHYIKEDSFDQFYCVAAVVTKISGARRNKAVDLSLFENGISHIKPHSHVEHSNAALYGTWHWPHECPIEQTTKENKDKICKE